MPSIAIPVSLRGQLLNSVRAAPAAFSPSTLFALNEPGVWYDPSDVANLAWRRNLLTFTEQFDNAAWTKSNLTVSGNQISYAGGSGLTRECVQLVTVPGGTANKVLTAYVTVSGSGKFRLKNTHSAVQDNFSANITATGTRQTVVLTVTNSASAGNGLQAISIITSTDDAAFNLTVHEFQLELGSVATGYQKITDVNTEVIERFPSATLYQDTAGTTPVTTPGQTVALALDKSKGLVLGSELVTNGTFDTNVTGWNTQASTTISWVAGELRAVSSSTTNTYIFQDIPTVSGVTYRYVATVRSASGNIYVDAYNGAFASLLRSVTLTAPTTNQTVNVVFTATGSSTRIGIGPNVATTFFIDNISVKELPGFHATQATLASRPTYGIVPLGGRRNLLTRTEEFSNAAWTNNPPITIASGVTDPVGGSTAFTFTAASGNAEIYQTFTGRTVGQAHTTQMWMRRRTGTGDIQLYANAAQTTVTLTTSWQLITLTQNASATTIYSGVRIVTSGNAIDVWHPQFELGSTATAYQRVGSAFDVTEAGVASLSYLFFGGDTAPADPRWMVTPTITPGIDKVQTFAGVRKLSDAAIGVIAETSTNSGGNDGAFGLYNQRPTAGWGFGSRGTVTGLAEVSTGYVSPISNVVTGLGDISGDRSTLRANGVQIAQATTDQGTGNYLAYPLYIGRRAGTSLGFNGQIFSLIVRFGTNLDAGTITSTETWVAGKTGVTL